jgi:predicted RNA-binding Zn-ribbon protein involved in translation (DUF1610 family)
MLGCKSRRKNIVEKNCDSLKILLSCLSILDFNRFKKEKKSNKFNKAENSRHEQTHNITQTQSYFNCPHCKQIINLENQTSDSITISCPNCGKIGLIQTLQKKQNNSHRTILNFFTTDTKLVNTIKELFKSITGVKIIGMIFIILGIIMQIIPGLFSINISSLFFIFGFIILLLMPNDRLYQKKSNHAINFENSSTSQKNSVIKSTGISSIKQFDISEGITLFLILWVGFFYFITIENSIEIFFIVTYLGILMIKVISNELLTLQVKQRMNILVVAFLLVFIIIVIKRIISIVRI